MPPLSMMIKPVSSACELACRYCFYADVSSHREKASYGKMTKDTMRALVRRAFIYADDTVSFAFQGGEPTLAGTHYFREFLSLVDEYNVRKLAVNYSLQTNAVSLTDEMCAFFAENDFLIGVSLDGCREIHDSLRIDPAGKGTYERVLHGISLLKKYNVDFNILCVVTSDIAKRAEQVWKSLAPYEYLQFIPCIDDFDGDKKEFSVSAADYGDFLIKTFGYYEAAIKSGSPVSERRFDNYINILLGQMPELCAMSGACGVYFLIEADGGVYPCDFYVLDQWRLGNINGTSFSRMQKSERAKAFIEMSGFMPEECRACQWNFLCRGGCRRDREPFSDGVPSGNRFCESYRMFFSDCYDRMTALAKIIKERYVR